MYIVLKTRAFEFAIEVGGIFLRVGRREFYWSREAGLTIG